MVNHRVTSPLAPNVSMLSVCTLLDDEISPEAFDRAYADLLADADLRDRLTSYQLIGDSLRGRTAPDDGYTLRILARLPRKTGAA